MDVYQHEPNVPPASFELDNVVLLPHMASAPKRHGRRWGALQINNLLLKLDVKPVKTPVE